VLEGGEKEKEKEKVNPLMILLPLSFSL